MTAATFDFGDGTAPAEAVGSPPSAVHTYTESGTYTITATAGRQTGSAEVTVTVPPPPEEEPEPEPEPEEPEPEEESVGEFDPGAYTVAQVQDYVSAHPQETARVHEAEVNGKNRSTLVTWLNDRLAGGS